MLVLAGSDAAGRRRRGDARGKIVSALITLAHNLKLTVTAEGVETHAQLDRLRALGCDTAQGWLFGPAGPPELITKQLTGCGSS